MTMLIAMARRALKCNGASHETPHRWNFATPPSSGHVQMDLGKATTHKWHAKPSCWGRWDWWRNHDALSPNWKTQKFGHFRTSWIAVHRPPSSKVILATNCHRLMRRSTAKKIMKVMIGVTAGKSRLRRNVHLTWSDYRTATLICA